jgi:hypothetical protein
VCLLPSCSGWLVLQPQRLSAPGESFGAQLRGRDSPPSGSPLGHAGAAAVAGGGGSGGGYLDRSLSVPSDHGKHYNVTFMHSIQASPGTLRQGLQLSRRLHALVTGCHTPLPHPTPPPRPSVAVMHLTPLCVQAWFPPNPPAPPMCCNT